MLAYTTKPAYSLDCKAVALKWVHQFRIPGGDNCNFYCSYDSLYQQFNLWKKNDACQGADGFSTAIPKIQEAPCSDCPGSKTCICSVQATAWRVRNGKWFDGQQWFDCDVKPYTERVLGRRWYDESEADKDIYVGYYSRGFISNDNVHCGSQ